MYPRVSQRSSVEQEPHGLPHLFTYRCLRLENAEAIDRCRSTLAHDRQAARCAPRTRPEIRSTHGPEKLSGNFPLAIRRGLGRIAQPLGTGQERWQAHRHIDPAVIVLTTQQQQAAFESELLDTTRERQIE